MKMTKILVFLATIILVALFGAVVCPKPGSGGDIKTSRDTIDLEGVSENIINLYGKIQERFEYQYVY